MAYTIMHHVAGASVSVPGQTRPLRNSVEPKKENSCCDKCGSSVQASTLRRSENIPISADNGRTISESKLDEEELLADHRDYAMFQRIVHGIRKSQCTTRDCFCRRANSMSLQNVFRTRNDDCRNGSMRSLYCFETSLTKCASANEQDEEIMPFLLEM
ncbi:hypothetical protein MPSEU_000021400 [Mayamaea pseudoterrestris]|nr:hypothetical protein MPSEU_000021400 [Mayamaea pseudoterrestris]